MEKSVDFLFRKKLACRLSVASLCALVVSLLLMAIAGPATEVRALELAIASGLGVVLSSSFIAMLLSTVHVAKERRNLTDWGMFLIFIWVIPYMGITLYLGGVSLLKYIRGERS